MICARMTDETKSILMNQEVIAIDQDPDYKPVTSVSSEGEDRSADAAHARWLGRRRTLQPQRCSRGCAVRIAAACRRLCRQKLKVRDLWKHEAVTMEGDVFKATVPSHGVVLLKISAK